MAYLETSRSAAISTSRTVIANFAATVFTAFDTLERCARHPQRLVATVIA